MCGRYRLKNTALMGPDAPKDFVSLLKLDRQLEHRPRYNVAPTQFNPVVLKPTPETDSTLAAFRWGLIPPWSRDLKMSFTTINARSETVATSKVFAEPFKNRHCLVPADGWYEWRALADGKQPYLVTVPDEETFCFAGLWQVWKPKDGEPINSFTILTTEANKHIRALHDRMPVIVPQSRWSEWLEAKGEPESSSLLQGPILSHNIEADVFTVRPVSRAMSNARNESAEAAAILDGPPLNPL
jgi:putative SOS response-associated peptidase YedK